MSEKPEETEPKQTEAKETEANELWPNLVLHLSPGAGKSRVLNAYAEALANLVEDASLRPPFKFESAKNKRERKDAREAQLALLKGLSAARIDPHLFDLMLSNELDRNLKKQFGIAFLVATVFFTLLSYGVIVGNSIFKWGISVVAITALIIETPIQFIGLLYIIARNLFPQSRNRPELLSYVADREEDPAQNSPRRAQPSTPPSRRQRDRE